MNAVRGVSQYQDIQQRTAAREAASDRVQAKVVTRTVGFRLGRFGVSYAAQDLEIDGAQLFPEAAGQGAGQGAGRLAASFAAELDVAVVRRQMADASMPEAAPIVSSRTPSALERRLGARAYAAATSTRVATPRMLTVAV